MGKYRGFYPPRVPKKLPFYESPCGFVSISQTLRAVGTPETSSLTFPNPLPLASPEKLGWSFQSEQGPLENVNGVTDLGEDAGNHPYDSGSHELVSMGWCHHP